MGKTIIINGKQFDFSRSASDPNIFRALRVLRDDSFCYENEKYIFSLDPTTHTFTGAKYLHKVNRVGSGSKEGSDDSNLELISKVITIANEALKEYESQIAAAGEITHLVVDHHFSD